LQRVPSRLGPLVFAAVLPLATALALLPGEFTHYKRWLELGTDETALRLAVLSAILSKTLLAITAAFAFMILCARFAAPRTLRVLSLMISILVLGFVAVDLELQRNTGNNIDHYFPFLLDPETFRWAGQGFDVWPGLLRVAMNLCFALVPAGVIAWVVEHWVARSAVRRGRALLSGLLALVVLVLISEPLFQRIGGAPAHLYHLREQMPWSWNSGIGIGGLNLATSQVEAQQLYARALPKLTEPRSLAGLLEKKRPAATPDILVIAVESLRYDALDPDTMPRLWAWSNQGVRLGAHYATSNASHYGMFALLYGRSPLFYFETVDGGEPPTLPTQLRQWGYTTHHITCTDIHWRGMDRFMGSEHFSVERMHGASLDACDRDVVERASSLLEPGERAPRFVLAFLMSTHFGYHFPDGVEPFQPSAAPPNALELNPDRDADREALKNRYRNSAHYVDSLIGSLLDRVNAEQTLVVVTGDHGESLLDYGTIAHTSLLSEIQKRVPFAMTGPGVLPGSARQGPTDHSDLLPTLLARLSVSREHLEAYPGQDMLQATGSPFVALVHAKARASEDDRIALVSPEFRYSIRLDAGEGELRFLGELGRDGRPSREGVAEQAGTRAVDWLDRYLNSLTSPW
jgi:hypothetical protein